MDLAKLYDILETLRKVEGIHGAILVKYEKGIVSVISESLPSWIDAESVAIVTGLFRKASDRASKELAQGGFKSANLTSAKGKMRVSNIPEIGILIVIATLTTADGIINVKTATAIKQINELIS